MSNSIDMTFYPSDNPGAHERHLIRRHQNSLFGSRAIEMTSELLQEVQKTDHDILTTFMLEFEQLLNKTVALKPNEDSDVVLAIKDSLEKLYATSVSVADDQTKIQESLKKLIQLVMESIKKEAVNDPRALQELEQEETAREAHYAFLKSTLVADMLDPESPIENEDLVPSLLSADKDDLALAIQLFDKEQVTLLIEHGIALLDELEVTNQSVNSLDKAAENFIFIEGYLKYLEQSVTI